MSRTAVVLPTRTAGLELASCPTTLRVVTASSYAPVLADVGPTLAAGPDCVGLDVTVADGRSAAARVAEVGADAWIPDDAGWAGNPGPARLAAAPAAGSGTVLATSPFYLVTDRDTAGRVTDAIHDAGFNSAGRLYAASRDLLGMRPKDYRAGGPDLSIRFAGRRIAW